MIGEVPAAFVVVVDLLLLLVVVVVVVVVLLLLLLLWFLTMSLSPVDDLTQLLSLLLLPFSLVSGLGSDTERRAPSPFAHAPSPSIAVLSLSVCQLLL